MRHLENRLRWVILVNGPNYSPRRSKRNWVLKWAGKEWLASLHQIMCVSPRLFSMQVHIPVSFWAVQRLGAVISPANPAYGPSELAYQLKDSGAVALVTTLALLPTALK